MKYIIHIPPVTKKNSQQIFVNRRTGKPFVTPSDAYKAYEASAGYYLRPKPKKPIETRCNVKCVYYMATSRKCDLANLIEATTDVLVKHGILSDDNYRIAATHDGSRVEIDRENPRTEITITEVGP